jgi:hypothetical protein
MLPPVYQNMVNLIVNLSISRCPSKFMNVTMWEHCTFGNKIFGYGKVYYSISIITIILCKLLFPVVGFKVSFLPSLASNLLSEVSYDI